MRRYETFVIIDPDLSQDIRDQVVERVEELISQMDGFLVLTDDWGERKLAYEIKKRARGYYVRFDYCGLSPLVNEIERFFRIDDRALKYMTVLLDKDADLEKIKEEKAAKEAAKEAAKMAAAESKTDVEEAPEETQKEVETAPVKVETAPVEVETAPVEVETAPVEVETAPEKEVGTAPVKEVDTAPEKEVGTAPEKEVDTAPE
ncbi:MAG: 30S ribosomal protein S6, partial [Deltaproteobacteria bacterium]|nr:30S ribosomal protein S6 [Deltaproteobacteria bacterium]